MPDTLAQMVRRKYPGVYDDMPDTDLEAKVRAKYPGAYDDVPSSESSAPREVPSQPSTGLTHQVSQEWLGHFVPPTVAMLPGALKGAANTAIGLGEMVKGGFGLGEMTPEDRSAFEAARGMVEPTTPTERFGRGAEQMAEFALLPATKGPAIVRGVRAALPAMGLSRAQGSSPGAAIATGALAAVPVVPAVKAAGKWVESKAVPLVRAATKPTVAALKRIPGMEGLEAKATGIVRFIIDNRLLTAEKARDVFARAERELQRVLSVRNAPTDAPQRAMRYLEALERSAQKANNSAEKVAQIRNAMAETIQSGLGEDVVRMVPRPHPSLVDPRGNPVTVLVPEVTRALRGDVPAKEALESARASSRWATRGGWGPSTGPEQAKIAADKATERAARDAVKAAVPEAKPLLAREAQAIRAQQILDRMEQRAANRDAVSLPAHVIAAGEIARGGVPVLAVAANWLRNNQMKAGVWADSLGKAIQRGDTVKVAEIMQRLGVAGFGSRAAVAK